MIVSHEAWGEQAAKLGATLAEWADEVRPGEVELLPHSHYSPRYAWMYAYEKTLRSRIARALGRPLGRWERRLFGPDAPVSEGLSNAFLHGNKQDPSRPIDVRCSVHRLGLRFVIRDRGAGFDHAGAAEAAAAGRVYFHVAGNGLACLSRERRILAAHSDGGRALHLLVWLSEGKAAARSAVPGPP